MPSRKLIYLIGFMGSGKTTLGRRLASALNWSFADLDRLIEESAGSTIPELFETKGEEFFRKLEEAELRKTALLSEFVVATGGGTPCYRENIDFMNRTGITIYIKQTPGLLASRLLRSPGDRPLIKRITTENLSDYINSTLEAREPFYMKASYVIDGMSVNVNTLVKSLTDNPARDLIV